MLETDVHASAFGSFGSHWPRYDLGAGLVLELREGRHGRIVELARPRTDAVRSSGIGDLPRIGDTRRSGDEILLALVPGRWMLISRDLGTDAAPAPSRDWTDAFEIAVDATDAWAQLAISGAAATDLLAKACALDLHPAVFRDGACAAARVAELRCVIWRAGSVYHLLVRRSHAESLAEWLIEAAAEFGLAPPDSAPSEARLVQPRPRNHTP